VNDLLVLVPDKNFEYGISGLLQRDRDLNIRPITTKILRHPEHDSGIVSNSIELLRPYLRDNQYVMIFFDWEGCGKENQSVDIIRNELKTLLQRNGWQNRCEVIIINPELEQWVWLCSDEMARIINWTNFQELKRWLIASGRCEPGAPKPSRPKEAFEAALKQKQIPRSSAIYRKIASSVIWDQCQDSEFVRFTQTLQTWFPREE